MKMDERREDEARAGSACEINNPFFLWPLAVAPPHPVWPTPKRQGYIHGLAEIFARDHAIDFANPHG